MKKIVELNPAISVIIPVYNTRAYVKECVDSVLAQTFRDFEILLVDDASTDGSLALCQKLYEKNQKVRILHHEKNRTSGAARNTGMKAARGKYISFLDSDDLFMPNALSCLYEKAEKYQADIVHSTGCYLPNGDIEHITVKDAFRTLIFDQLPTPREAERIPWEPALRTALWAERKLSGVVMHNLYKKDFLEKHQLCFEEDIVPGQDVIFLFRCVFYAPVYVRIPDVFYIYRRPATSVTRTRRDARFLARLVENMVKKVRSLDRYMEEIPYFHSRPEEREKVRECVVLDTDPFFVQECYRGDGRVEGDLSEVRQTMEKLFGRDSWLMEYYFHAYHRKNQQNRPGRGMQVSYMFPWHLFPEGSRVVIYGAGEVGKCFYEQAVRFDYIALMGIVDKNAGSISTMGIPVQEVEALSHMEFDYLLISVINRKIAEEIRRNLIRMGIGEEKILWDGETYSIDDHYQKVCFPLLRARQIIIYGAGLNAQEYARFLARQGRSGDIRCFAVTRRDGLSETLCGKPLLSIEEAAKRYPKAGIHVALQEKYHEEVRETLRGLGREAEKYIGLRAMTRLLGDEALQELSVAFPAISVERKPKDYSMLYLSPRTEQWKLYEFYPMTQVPLSEADLRNLKRAVEEGHDEIFGSYPKAPVLRERNGGEPSLFLAMASSRKDAPVSWKGSLPPYLHRVVAGAADFREPREEGAFYDDAGENISEKNPFYSELTVTYWLWKNAPAAEYLGLCHYRRHFRLDRETLRKLQAGEVDFLVPRPRLTFPSVRRYFSELPVTSMTGEDYEVLMEMIRCKNAEDAELAERIFEGNIHFPNNMLIARRDMFGEYSRWIFEILEAVDEEWERRRMKRPPRCMGYLGELLTTLFLAKRHEKYSIEYVDYELLG